MGLKVGQTKIEVYLYNHLQNYRTVNFKHLFEHNFENFTQEENFSLMLDIFEYQTV